jgi:uncharacterized protein
MRRAVSPLCLLLLTVAAVAADFASLKPQGYLSDYAGVIPAPVKAAVERYCAEVEAKTGAQIAVLVIPSLQGEPVEDVAVDVFQKWGIGKKGSDEGVLLLLATQDRRMRLEVGYGLEPIIPDGFAGEVLRAMRPALRSGDYGGAIVDAVRTLGARIATAKGVSIGEALPQAQRRRAEPGPALFPLLFLGLVFLLWIVALARSGRGWGPRGRTSGTDMLTGMLLGSILGRSIGPPRGGGGFGGYSGGGGFGGFGGFGGGRSGGGGASGSW